DLPRQIDWLLHRRKKVRLGSILSGIAGLACTRALYSYFIENDVDGLKQNFYVATKLTLASVGQDGGASFEVGGDFLCALLSDSAEVIGAMAHIESPELGAGGNTAL